ncbi:MAG TPA: ParA family protein [Nitrososphaerales archaeon]|nr:ParA family protein [Nitrososphaerales archaeon]
MTPSKGQATGSKTRLAMKEVSTKIIAVANQKGGVGKTDLTVNISCQLASLGKKVLLIDMDPQANATTYLVAPDTQILKTTADLLLEESLTLEDVVIRDCRENLDVVPSDVTLSACQIKLANDIGMQFKLKRKLKALAEGSAVYDYVIIDTPPSLGLLTVNTLAAASRVIIPIQTQYLAMEGVVQLDETIRKVKEDINPGLGILGAVLTLYDRRTLISREVETKVREGFAGRVFATVIPVNVRLAEAPSHHKSIFEYDPECNGARAYRGLAKEILECPDA